MGEQTTIVNFVMLQVGITDLKEAKLTITLKICIKIN